jgi:diguanylate cyclase (GGDEF)-like protein
MSTSDELTRLRELNAELAVVCETIRDVTSTLSVGEVLQRLLDRTLTHLTSEIGSILLADSDRSLRIAVARGLPSYVVEQTRVQPGEGVSGYVAATGKPLLVGDIETDARFKRRNHERYYTRSLLSAPIVLQNSVRGVMNVNNKRSHEPYTEADLRLLEAIAGHAAIALQNAERFEEMLERAQRDALTGLANHGHFWSTLDVELKRADRYARQLSVVMIDVDEFKAYNDLNGHVGGDEALAAIARVIQDSCRSSDLAARYGGEEFAIILPETSLEGAAAFGEKIRLSVEEEPFGKDAAQRLTVSVGAAAFPDDGEGARLLVEAADRQLYRAKSEGRNRVCTRPAKS